jgi:hypothetical protein
MTNNLTQQAGQSVNPGIKQSGAPVPFSPQAQNNITGVFGNPMSNSYDRSMTMNPGLGTTNNIVPTEGFAPPVPTIAPIVPPNNLY